MIVALYVLVTLSLVFAQRCLRPEQDTPEPSINQIDLAELSLSSTAFCTKPLDEQQTRASEAQPADDCDATVTTNHAPLHTIFAHIDAQNAARISAVHADARLPSTPATNARSRAPPALLT